MTIRIKFEKLIRRNYQTRVRNGLNIRTNTFGYFGLDIENRPRSIPT